MLLCQIAVESLVEKGQKVQDYNNNNLVADKLNTLSKKYEKAKGNSFRVI